MRIFVAGATGAVGRLLVPLLIRDGHEVTGISRTEAGAEALVRQGAVAATVDVYDSAALTRAVAAAAPEVVVHQLTALADGNPADNARIRREGTRNLVEAATAAGVRRMVVQSIAWAYEPGDTPATEDTPLDLSAPQPRAVTVGGVEALESQASRIGEHVVLRYGTFYGPGTWYSPDDRVGKLFREGGFTATDAVTSFVHVEDAAAAAALAVHWPVGTYNITDDEPAPAHVWAPVLAERLGAPAPAIGTGRAGWERGADNNLARTRIGWRPKYPTWRTGFSALT